MDGRVRNDRKHNWIGPVLWLLAASLLVRAFIVLLRTSPHKSTSVSTSSIAATPVLSNRDDVDSSHAIAKVGTTPSGEAMLKRLSTSQPTSSRSVQFVSSRVKKKTQFS